MSKVKRMDWIFFQVSPDMSSPRVSNRLYSREGSEPEKLVGASQI